MEMSLQRGIRTESTTQILDDNDTNIVTNRKKHLRKYIRATGIINVVAIVILLVLFILKSRLYEKGKTATKEKEATYRLSNADNGVCMPCNYLGREVKAEDTLFDSITNTESGGRICCYKEQSQLQILISRMMDPQITKPIPDVDELIYNNIKWWRNRKNSLHMYLDVDRLQENYLVWTKKNDYLGTSYANNVFYNDANNSMEVLQPGVYFIYSVITFDFGDISSVTSHSYEIKKWHRLLPKTQESILKSRFGGSSETERIYTSFLCGAFKLDNSTNVMIEMPAATLANIKKSKYASYFGLFMI